MKIRKSILFPTRQQWHRLADDGKNVRGTSPLPVSMTLLPLKSDLTGEIKSVKSSQGLSMDDISTGSPGETSMETSVSSKDDRDVDESSILSDVFTGLVEEETGFHEAEEASVTLEEEDATSIVEEANVPVVGEADMLSTPSNLALDDDHDTQTKEPLDRLTSFGIASAYSDEEPEIKLRIPSYVSEESDIKVNIIMLQHSITREAPSTEDKALPSFQNEEKHSETVPVQPSEQVSGRTTKEPSQTAKSTEQPKQSKAPKSPPVGRQRKGRWSSTEAAPYAGEKMLHTQLSSKVSSSIQKDQKSASAHKKQRRKLFSFRRSSKPESTNTSENSKPKKPRNQNPKKEENPKRSRSFWNRKQKSKSETTQPSPPQRNRSSTKKVRIADSTQETRKMASPESILRRSSFSNHPSTNHAAQSYVDHPDDRDDCDSIIQEGSDSPYGWAVPPLYCAQRKDVDENVNSYSDFYEEEDRATVHTFDSDELEDDDATYHPGFLDSMSESVYEDILSSCGCEQRFQFDDDDITEVGDLE